MLAAQLPSPENPGARWGHVFVYDSARDQILLFGGARERGAYLDDTWTWDGEVWQHHQVSGPSPRGFPAATFHNDRWTVMLHGGRGPQRLTYSDTWEWDGANWRQVGPESPFEADHHQMVYIAHDNSILAFGGWNGQDVAGETWQWNGSWKRGPVEGPPKRGAFAMAYDTQTEKVLLFGGLWIDGQYADLWRWQGGAWHRQSGPYDNSSLDHHAMVYDQRRQQLIIFGGKNYRYVPQNRTQTIAGDQVQILTAEGPSPRHSVGLTYDTRRGQAILYGGKEYRGDLQLPLGDHWRWDGQSWHLVQP